MFRNLRRRLHDLFSLPQPAPRMASSFDSLISANETDFRILAENSADVILRVGPDMKATYVSPSARLVLGWEPAELLGRHPKDLYVPKISPSSRLRPQRSIPETPRRLRRRHGFDARTAASNGASRARGFWTHRPTSLGTWLWFCAT